MYDVLYIDPTSHCNVVASGLNRESASQRARDEARARNVGRMFLSGSARVPRSHTILIVRSGP